MLLEVKGLTKRFGGLIAVNNFDISVDHGEIMGLLGPNGAGKSTIFDLITGVTRLNEGSVIFNGKNITGKKPYQVAEEGIGRTFQLNPLFGEFTVLENVIAACHLHPKSSLLGTYFNSSAYRYNEKVIVEYSQELLRIVGLEHIKDEIAKNLPHGYQKMLGVARALATRPKLLLMDEPLGGMNPSEINFSLKAIEKLREQGLTFLIVEHNMRILKLCERIVVISFGEKIFEGSSKQVTENTDVIAAYFGSQHIA